MFVVTEEDEAAIRAVYEQRGEFAAALELRRRFPGITDNAQARECARTIAGWKPLAAEASTQGAAVTSDRLTGNRRGSTLIARELASSSPSPLSFIHNPPVEPAAGAMAEFFAARRSAAAPSPGSHHAPDGRDRSPA